MHKTRREVHLVCPPHAEHGRIGWGLQRLMKEASCLRATKPSEPIPTHIARTRAPWPIAQRKRVQQITQEIEQRLSLLKLAFAIDADDIVNHSLHVSTKRVLLQALLQGTYACALCHIARAQEDECTLQLTHLGAQAAHHGQAPLARKKVETNGAFSVLTASLCAACMAGGEHSKVIKPRDGSALGAHSILQRNALGAQAVSFALNAPESAIDGHLDRISALPTRAHELALEARLRWARKNRRGSYPSPDLSAWVRVPQQMHSTCQKTRPSRSVAASLNGLSMAPPSNSSAQRWRM
eukprot:7382258-Prymnesium_polylepis.4